MSKATQPVIALEKSKEAAELEKVYVERYVQVGGDNFKRKVNTYTMADQTDPEVAIMVAQGFQDVSGQSQLSFTGAGSGQAKFDYFSQILSGQALTRWNTCATGQPRTLAGFTTTQRAWLDLYIPQNAVRNQKDYFKRLGVKPRNMSVVEFNSRLDEINVKSAWFSSDGDAADRIYNDDELKELLYDKMLDAWKVDMDRAGKNVDDMTRAELVTYMTTQMTNYNATQGRVDRSRQRRSTRGGRGRRGGRSSGRQTGRYVYSPYARGGYQGGSPYSAVAVAPVYRAPVARGRGRSGRGAGRAPARGGRSSGAGRGFSGRYDGYSRGGYGYTRNAAMNIAAGRGGNYGYSGSGRGSYQAEQAVTVGNDQYWTHEVEHEQEMEHHDDPNEAYEAYEQPGAEVHFLEDDHFGVQEMFEEYQGDY